MQDIFGFLKKHPDKKDAFNQAGEAFNKKYSQSIQNEKPDDFPQHWKELKKDFKALKKDGDSFGRCYICEKELNDTYADDIEHFRPKKEVKHADGTKSDGYWWLAYDYLNYMRTCAECNRAEKGNEFPLEHENDRVAYESRHLMHLEKPLLINPMYEDSTKYFIVAFIPHPENNSEGSKVAILLPNPKLTGYELRKAETTIDVFCLDLRYRAFLYQNSGNRPHRTFLKTSAENSRLDLCFHFYNKLAELAEKRQNMGNDAFLQYWKELASKPDSVTAIGLARLIALTEFTDHTHLLH